MSYTGRSGVVYKLGKKIGEGGEGILYALQENTEQVAKIYKASKFHTVDERKKMERKLKAMLDMSLRTKMRNRFLLKRTVILAWPQDILYENGVMAGFVMPRIDARYKLYDICRSGPNAVRERIYPAYTWKDALRFACKLAWITGYVHEHNIVIGDFNPNNIVIDTVHDEIVLIDCDSFDIRDPKTKEHFPCTVGLAEMLAPELQSAGNLANAVFTKESDDFSLAIHIFRLLMDNADPFGAAVVAAKAQSQSQIPANQAIMNGECVYVRRVRGKRVPEWSLKLKVLPPRIQELFRDTFRYTASTMWKKRETRATEWEWHAELERLSGPKANRLLKTCKNNKKHVFAAHNRTCPWCKREKKAALSHKKRKNRNKIIAACLLFGIVIAAFAGFKLADFSKTRGAKGILNWNGHTYALFDNCSSWEEAKAFCESRGGYLAVIGSKEENDALFAFTKQCGYESAYFGFADDVEEGSWYWVNHEDTEYTNWHLNEPNGENPQEDYAMFYYKFKDGTWNDGDFGVYTVNSGSAFLCEWE